MSDSSHRQYRHARVYSAVLGVGIHVALIGSLVGAGMSKLPTVQPEALRVSLITPSPRVLPVDNTPSPAPPAAQKPVVQAPKPQAGEQLAARSAIAPPIDAAPPTPNQSALRVESGAPPNGLPHLAPAETATVHAAAALPSVPSAAGPQTMQIGLVCPLQVKPMMPAKALRDGVEGSVTARITVRAGKVIQVDITSSEPRGMFDAAVRKAVAQYRCESPADVEVVATQVFEFRMDF
jgi:protein TonB